MSDQRQKVPYVCGACKGIGHIAREGKHEIRNGAIVCVQAPTLSKCRACGGTGTIYKLEKVN